MYSSRQGDRVIETESEAQQLPVVPDEDEVSLVVEGDHSPALELRDLREPGGQQPRHAVTQASGEVVQYDLWLMVSHHTMAL